ncbi:MAG TPA: hypothetical protein VGL01_20250 [Trinickia sp.]|uniref:hypothetical protein n=1 Tax=Trinickia sp. TaxID=2571163 RepID=UPI002F3F043B
MARPSSIRQCADFMARATQWLALHARKIRREIPSAMAKPISNSISKSSDEHERLLAGDETGAPNEKINSESKLRNAQAALRS